jgi:hypothetical protein
LFASGVMGCPWGSVGGGRRAPSPDRARDTARAMSQENVEIMRRALETAVREPEPDFVNVLFHPDHELVRLVSFRRGASLRGEAAGCRAYTPLVE